MADDPIGRRLVSGAGGLPPSEDVSPAALRARLVNEAAEQALLGALLMSNRAYLAVSEIVAAEHFGFALHGRLFAGIAALVEAGHPANPATLGAYFGGDAAMKDIGGINYLVQLVKSAITISNAPHYAEAIVDLAQRRALILACEDAMADAAMPDIERPAAVVYEEHERRLAEAAEGRARSRGMVSIGEAAGNAVRAAEAAHRGDTPYLSTGLVTLDRIIGGLLPGDLEVIAARPGMGKTAAALGMAWHAARSGVPVAFFSLEQPADQLGQRLLARLSGISADRQQEGDLSGDEWHRYTEAQASIEALPLHVDDTPGLSVGQIAARARRAHRRHKIGLVVIDHLQLIGGQGRSESRRIEIDEATRKLKALAKDMMVPVLLLSQLNRAVESRDDKRPTLSDLRESGSIEQDADRVIFIYREEYYLRPALHRAGESDSAFSDRAAAHAAACDRVHGIAQFIVAKNRHGSTKTANLHWSAGRMAFDDLGYMQ